MGGTNSHSYLQIWIRQRKKGLEKWKIQLEIDAIQSCFDCMWGAETTFISNSHFSTLSFTLTYAHFPHSIGRNSFLKKTLHTSTSVTVSSFFGIISGNFSWHRLFLRSWGAQWPLQSGTFKIKKLFCRYVEILLLFQSWIWNFRLLPRSGSLTAYSSGD